MLGTRLEARWGMDLALCEIGICSDRCTRPGPRAYLAKTSVAERIVLRGNT